MKVLIVDDNKDFCTTVADIVAGFGYDPQTIFNPRDAIAYADDNHKNIGVAFLDIEFGASEELTGLDILDYYRKHFPEIPVIMISGKGTIETAVRATKLGAVNFIEKSLVSSDRIKNVLNAAVDRFGEHGEAKEIRKFLEMHGIIAKSPQMIDIGDNIIRFGRTELNILITGETGTGKKLVAKAIHAISRRNRFPFVTVDIPNIPSELFQSELFGHLKGSFSGAVENKKGLFHQADRGTLFLDEIGDLAPDLQSNLLLPIEEKYVRRIGAVENEEIDVRIISATDRDLISSIKDNKYRQQLYHRLRECEIHLPPLKDRREDIPEIAEYYLKMHNDQFSDEKNFSPSALEFLKEQEWQGNIRELASTLKVALQTIRKETLELGDLHKILGQNASSYAHRETKTIISNDRTLKEDLASVDRQKIESVLRMSNGNVSKSAAQLGISRETLHNKIRRYEIDVSQFRKKRAK
jgi:two-component system, NtrC family, nitrogen regulation response regulator NtrX